MHIDVSRYIAKNECNFRTQAISKRFVIHIAHFLHTAYSARQFESASHYLNVTLSAVNITCGWETSRNPHQQVLG